MPHFFMHLTDGDKRTDDPQGRSFADLPAARDEAVRAAREIVAEKVRHGEVVDGEAIEICDASGMLLDTVTLKSVFQVK